MNVYDIILEDSDDLRTTAGGDFEVGESTVQHQYLLLGTSQGQWKRNPYTGVGVMQFIDDEGPLALKRKIMQQFQRDGMTVTDLQHDEAALRNDNLIIYPNANY
ncbi:MAG: oxidase [Chitinophagia bacterium]|nr:oxidase [Chitinophagia bacterium]